MTETSVSAWAPFQHKVFRALWIAQLASNVGTWMHTVGAAWLLVELDASPAVISLVQTATYLPVVLAGVAAGALADLVDRRRLLLVTQSLMLLVAGLLATLTLLEFTQPWSLLVLTFALGLGTALNMPAWQAIQPELVPRQEFPQAITLGGASINLGRAIGPAVGGVLIAMVGVWLVFLLNAVSFAAVLLVLWHWRRPAENADGPSERFVGAVRAGMRFALFNRLLHSVLIRTFAFALAATGFLALLPVYSSKVLGLGSGGLGLLYAGFGGGAVVTAAVFPRVHRRLSADSIFTLGTLIVAVCLSSLWLVRDGWLALAATVFGGVGWLFCVSTLNVASQEVLPGWVRARGLALYLTAISAGIAIGSVAWGHLANVVGAPQTFAWGAVALVATLFLALRWRFSRIAGLDLSPAPMAAPEVRLPIDDAGTPVLVVVAYEVRPEREDEFLQRVRRLGRSRRRTGATSWSVYQDADRPHRFVETYVVPSWEEHLRQGARWTVADATIWDQVLDYLRDDSEPTVKHFVAPPQLSFTARWHESMPGASLVDKSRRRS